jgi:acyl carrier protein
MSVEEVIREVFALDNGTEILDSHGPGGLDGWDSLGHVSLIAKLEESFGVSIDMEEMIEIESVGDLRKLLADKVSS